MPSSSLDTLLFLSHALHLAPAARMLDVTAFAVCVHAAFRASVSKLPMPSSSLDTHGSLLRAKHRVGRILLDYDGFAVL